ncbi:CNNM domain-containing protein [Prosthecobacter vanneervenii]|uniref:CBS domain containing-hemolysin-like protein n=1 Tax=Prosthecobacter vanneervenii TaxID=48466 RepID=A0A7W7YBU5_9BACT|nr:CNNM domain-containing protein [Prosthecobacter vanneervenii]MBB5032985.1 CBS domain containing-hemolysin-like protein [Prosthecobacter vanneervenii]
MSLLVAFSIYLALLLLLATISATETAIHSARDIEAQLLAAGEGAVAQKLRAITANPFAQLHRTLLLSAGLNLALAALGLWIVTGPLRALGWNAWLTSSVLFLATVLLGDMAPKFFAARNPSVVLLGSLRLLHPLRNVLDPLAALVDRTTDVLLQKFVTRHVKMRMPVTRDEFETLVEMRQEQGLLDSDESSMIHEALDIEALTVRDCMVPRVDLALISSEDAADKITATLEKAASRFVIVYGETPDSVEGVIDTSEWKLANRPDWRTLMRTPAFVPETMPVLEALEHHLQGDVQPVLIADEYGGLEGMITRREIADWLLYEAAPWHGEASEIRDLGHGRFLLDGGTRLDHIHEELGVELHEDGIDTIGGLVFNQLGHVPKPGERIGLEEADIKVRRIVRARIQEVELRLKPKPAPSPEAE